jgi:uncharacterized protein with ParB-like and HNH nuclease domain
MKEHEQKMVDSRGIPLKELFAEKFDVDFYQREYVWQKQQIEDLINDLSNEFLKNWTKGNTIDSVRNYDPYFMGEIVLAVKNGTRNFIIDGQQRITTFTLLLIYLLKKYGNLDKFPRSDIEKLIYSDDYGTLRFNLDIDERKECMLSLYYNGNYTIEENDSLSVKNILERYMEISECWNENINEDNIINFTYWIKEKVIFSKVWTNNDEFAYVIFETMNDRGLSLTQIEMLRSYLLSNISSDKRNDAMTQFDKVIKKLMNIKLSSKSKAEFEFFKIYFRGHLAEDLSQNKNYTSDFTQIGKEFHRWVRDNSNKLGLKKSEDYEKFISKIEYFVKIYERINNLILKRDTKEYLYLIVNNDYGFTLQPALILASVKYNDSDEIVDEKIKIVSKYLSKVLSWRVWNHMMISQSSLEATIYDLCKKIRDMDLEKLKNYLYSNPIPLDSLENAPTLNQQNKSKLRVLISLITEIVARESNESNYMLNQKDIEVEHIWSNHFEEHKNEFSSESEFAIMRNNIGDLLVLPKTFNASYNDDPYEIKVNQYFGQNILAQSLNKNKYKNNPSFLRFIQNSNLNFKSYDVFNNTSIIERADLYRNILLWNWKEI